MNDWKTLEKEGKIRKAIKSKITLLGKKVKRFNEEGVIVIDSFDNEEPGYEIIKNKKYE